MKKHLTWFPFLVVALTVLLAVTIVVYDRHKNQPAPVVLIDDVLIFNDGEGIDKDEYYEEMRRTLAPIWEIVDGQAAENVVIVNARNALLEIKVPLEERDVHIQLVAALNTLEAGLRGDDKAFADAQIRFSEIKSNNVWIQ